MRRAGDIIGLTVIDVASGKKLGQVEDLLFDREGRFLGLCLEQGSWFDRKPFLPAPFILSIGEDCVTVPGPLPKEEKEVQPQGYWFGRGEPRMQGRPVITVNGKQLGVLEEVYFDEVQGRIVGYELSDGFVSDLLDGRHIIRHPDQFLFGEDAFVVQQADPGS